MDEMQSYFILILLFIGVVMPLGHLFAQKNVSSSFVETLLSFERNNINKVL